MKKNRKSTLTPVIMKVDTRLDKYLEMNLFQDKVDKANEMLRTIGLPQSILR
jgi:hypothetical protein